MKECFAITTYCNTDEKIQALERTIKNLRQYKLDIVIHAHYPISREIQKKVDYYYYSSDNPILRDRWNCFWYFTDNYKLEVKVYDYYYTVLKAWGELILWMGSYDRIHMVNYDTNLYPELFELSKKYDKSLFLQNKNTTKNYIVPTYFCLNKKSFDFFRENITLEKYLQCQLFNGPFLPLVEEFIPSFTVGEDFFQIPFTEYDENKLLEYDVALDTRFDWEKTMTLKNCKIFIGDFDGSASVLIFDATEPLDVNILVNGVTGIYGQVDSTELFNMIVPLKDIQKLEIKINNVIINPDLIKKFVVLESKIYPK